jgi:hypothetical protein
MQDWSLIQFVLTAWENEGGITTWQLNTLEISLTDKGLESARHSNKITFQMTSYLY